ncbi:hypothetical protein GTP58_21090 [Duganella sp. CY15W]|uniref:ATP-grasp domain-containing protein n=1 Tax=Duganella sp. CY15W TaxID=2692172 RepID=UPI00136C1246|nr:hypothetical protein [Duganella sp. CY15W]MYM30835.1 hypothetical protein [Duganella sp. CY15W]
MKKILIITQLNDIHAHAVYWGLRQRGAQPVLWYWADFPEKNVSTFQIGNHTKASARFESVAGPVAGPFDVIWVRRKGMPQARKGAHPDDLEAIKSESEDYLQSILPTLAHGKTAWINDQASDLRAGNKIEQLVVAKKIGFKIPETLIGNDYNEIREFFRKHNKNVIVKAFYLWDWDNPDGSKTVARTSRVTSVHFESRYPIEGCPAIYQELIEKTIELRITVMGEKVIAAAIDSQRDGPTIDWRCEGGRGQTNLLPYELDSALEQRCVRLCRELDIVFGCIDMIVDKKGDFIFLEVNKMGQFLWKEDAMPALAMLEHFCHFVLGSAAPAQHAPLKLADFYRSEHYRQVMAALP